MLLLLSAATAIASSSLIVCVVLLAYLVIGMDATPLDLSVNPLDLPVKEAILWQKSLFLGLNEASHSDCHNELVRMWGLEGFWFRPLPPRLPLSYEEWPRKKRAWHLLSRRRWAGCIMMMCDWSYFLDEFDSGSCLPSFVIPVTLTIIVNVIMKKIILCFCVILLVWVCVKASYSLTAWPAPDHSMLLVWVLVRALCSLTRTWPLHAVGLSLCQSLPKCHVDMLRCHVNMSICDCSIWLKLYFTNIWLLQASGLMALCAENELELPLDDFGLDFICDIGLLFIIHVNEHPQPAVIIIQLNHHC